MAYTNKYSDTEIQSWKAMYEAGLSTIDIAKKTGASEATVYRRLFKIMTLRNKSAAALIVTRTGSINPQGYRRMGQRLAHRIVASNVLGRDLTRTEQVHHVNEDKADNTPSNLWVFPSCSAHTKYHQTGVIHPDTIKLEDYQ